MYFINSQDPHLQSLPICPELYHTQNPGTFFSPLMNKAQNYSQIGILYKAVCNQMHHWLLLLVKLMGLAFSVQALGFRINTNLCSTLKSNFLESVLLSREVFFLVHLHWRPYMSTACYTIFPISSSSVIATAFHAGDTTSLFQWPATASSPCTLHYLASRGPRTVKVYPLENLNY